MTSSLFGLPQDIWTHKIFNQCSPEDILQFRLVCKTWHQVTSDDSLWKFFLEKDFNQTTALSQVPVKKQYLLKRKEEAEFEKMRKIMKFKNPHYWN